jgi:hypothetical protein
MKRPIHEGERAAIGVLKSFSLYGAMKRRVTLAPKAL